jgi:hypothetical protein
MTMLCTSENLRLVDALCRTDLVSFIQKAFHTLSPSSILQMNYHIWALAYHLELVQRGEIRTTYHQLPAACVKVVGDLSRVSSIRPPP